MDLESYTEMIRSIVVQQLTQSGWVELIRMPIESPEDATPDQIQTSIEAIHTMIYRAEKLELSIQGVQLCLRNLDEGTVTFRVCASSKGTEGPVLVA